LSIQLRTAVGHIAHNARRLGEVADGVRIDLNYHKRSEGAEYFWFPLRPLFR